MPTATQMASATAGLTRWRGGLGGPAGGGACTWWPWRPAAVWDSYPRGAALLGRKGWRSTHLPPRAPEVAQQAGPEVHTSQDRSSAPGSRWPPTPVHADSSGGLRLPTVFLCSIHGSELTLHSCRGAELLATPLPHPRHTECGDPEPASSRVSDRGSSRLRARAPAGVRPLGVVRGREAQKARISDVTTRWSWSSIR